jgi:eukaryotic-like serine/threonine-protein kinase
LQDAWPDRAGPGQAACHPQEICETRVFLTVAALRSMFTFVDSLSSGERSELSGTTLDGQYRVGSRLAGGGTGIVFDGMCLRSRKPIALKTLRPHLVNQTDLATRLRRELEVSRKVVHPGIVRFFGEGLLTDGSPFLVMPRLRGVSLGRLMDRYGELPTHVVLLIASRLSSVLHSSHMAGYVHRDVKPEHILLTETPEGELRVHLLDFGVCWSAAADAAERKRESGRVFGTPHYVSPEQAAGEALVDGRADLFGLGVVLFEALTGGVPFSASTVTKLLVKIIRDDAPRVRDFVEIEPAVDELVAQLLAREPKLRMQSARALSRALLPYAPLRMEAEKQLLGYVRETCGASASSATVERKAPAIHKYQVA